MYERTPGEVRVEELSEIRIDMIKIRQTRMIMKAIQIYENVRYGHDFNIAFDAAVDETLKQMGMD